MIKHYLYTYIMNQLTPFVKVTPIHKDDWSKKKLSSTKTINILSNKPKDIGLQRKIDSLNLDVYPLATLTVDENNLALRFEEDSLSVSYPFEMNFNENNVFNSSLSSVMDKQKNYYASIHLYSDRKRETFISLLSRINQVNIENMVVSNGSSECIYYFYRAIKKLYGYHTIISFDPTFDYQLFYGDNHNLDEGFNEVKVTLNADFGYDFNALEEAINSHPKSVVYICNPNNPTGLMEDTNEILRLIEKYPNNFFLIDEAYAEFDSSHVSVLQQVEKLNNLAVTKTFSKFYGLAGLRLGYLVANKKIVEIISSFNSLVNPNIAACEIAIDMLKNSTLYDEVYQRNQDNIALVEKRLDHWGLRYLKSSGNFVFFDLEDNYDTFFNYLLSNGLLPARDFPAMKGWMRMSLIDPLSTGYFVYLLDEYFEKKSVPLPVREL